MVTGEELRGRNRAEGQGQVRAMKAVFVKSSALP